MEERGPWKTISVEERYSTPWIAVSHHEVLDPSGTPGIYGVIHFKNLAVGIVALDAELNTWIVGQYRYPLGVYSWEIPKEVGAVTDPPSRVPDANCARKLGSKPNGGRRSCTWT